MILDRFAARHALKAIGLVLMSLGSLPIRSEPAHAQAHHRTSDRLGNHKGARTSMANRPTPMIRPHPGPPSSAQSYCPCWMTRRADR